MSHPLGMMSANMIQWLELLERPSSRGQYCLWAHFIRSTKADNSIKTPGFVSRIHVPLCALWLARRCFLRVRAEIDRSPLPRGMILKGGVV